MKRVVRVLTLPYPVIDANRPLGNRNDELVMFGVDAVLEVFALTVKRLEALAKDEPIIFVHSLNSMAGRLVDSLKRKLNGICQVSSLAEFERMRFVLHFMPSEIRKSLEHNMQQFEILFGPFGEAFDALYWHEHDFVERVGIAVGEAFLELADWQIIGLCIAHQAAYYFYHDVRPRIHIKCSEKFRCSVCTHERDLAKAIAKGMLRHQGEVTVS